VKSIRFITFLLNTLTLANDIQVQMRKIRLKRRKLVDFKLLLIILSLSFLLIYDFNFPWTARTIFSHAAVKCNLCMRGDVG